ncbi:MAG: tetratricopeptide repeat protein [Candidatus Scalindua sp.]
MSKRPRRKRKKKPPPNGTNNTDNDAIEDFSSREQLAHLSLYAMAARNEKERKEIELERKKLERKSKLHWYSKPLFLQAIIAGIIAAPVLWFYVKDVVSSRENIKLSREIEERNQDLIEERKELDEMILQHEVDIETFMHEQDLLVEKNAILEKEFSEKNVKLEQEYKHKIKTLDGTYAKKMLALKEEYMKKNKELDEMILQHEVDIETFMHEQDLLAEKNAILEKEFSGKNVKLEQEYKHKIKTLDGTYAKKMLALKEEYMKKNNISSFDNWYSRGVGEFIDGKNAKAIDSFNKALETNPDTEPAASTHNYIGLSNERRGKTKEAIESYTKAIEIYKEYAVAYINRGSAYFRLKEYKKAFKDANIAIVYFIIKREYKAAKEHIEDKLQDLKRVETDEKFDENMKKSAENHITTLKKHLIATLKKHLEEVQKRTTEWEGVKSANGLTGKTSRH